MSGTGPLAGGPGSSGGLWPEGLPRMSGRLLESPPGFATKVFALGCVGAGIAWYMSRMPFGSGLHESVARLEEHERVGDISQRTIGAPVFRNPMRHGIPGTILGPEDMDKE